jgi:ubiquinone/menaquinone biosynthesis C-methylase UbiE
MTRPDLNRALAKYRRRAKTYDRRVAPTARYRRRAVECLLLGSGDTVLDVACGTGINFPYLEDYVGPSGHILGVDASPDMLVQAKERIEREGWSNVSLLESTVEQAEIETLADAALFSLTHDVLRSPRAVANVARHVKDGGRVASFGAKWATPWLFPVNLGVWLIARRFVTTLEGLGRPWEYLEPFVSDLEVDAVALGGAYVASGTVRHAGGVTG